MFEFIIGAWQQIYMFLHESTALLAILAAVGIYFYGILDPRIPKFIIVPVCLLLFYYGAYTFGDIEGAKRERIVCEKKSEAALNKATSQYLQSSLMLKHTLQQYESLQSEYKDLANSEQAKFNTLIENLTKKPEGKANELQPVQTATACLPMRVPPSLVQSLNSAISGSKQ